jgi:hypothetical protein
MSSRLLLVLPLACLAGCFNIGQPEEPPALASLGTGRGAEPHVGPSSEFQSRLLEIARTYESYGRLDSGARWAPAPCAAPPPQSQAHISASTDAASHGRKLYSLFAKELPKDNPSPDTYIVNGKPNPVGQVIVKEAWVPEEVPDEGRVLEPITRVVTVGGQERPDSFLPYARKEGHLYHAKEKAGLFIMFKMDPTTPGTDDSWVYGTVTADGQQVTSAGRVESCVRCHRAAPHDRLFGPPDR